MKKNYFTKVFFALLVGLFSLANANAQFLEDTETVDIVQITTWMTPNNASWGTDKPYVASDGTDIVFQTDATSDNTKWYEIPAGGNAFDQQVYYYKNVATGVYLQGSIRTPGEGGDWTVSVATASATNDGSNLFKWSKVSSNWGNGPWLVNEEGNTGELPSGDNKNAFFALTMLTANSEFFGVDVPNVAVSNPHDGGNAWTAVEINTISTGVPNPDIPHFLKNAEKVDVIQITTWMTPNNATWGTDKPYVASDGTDIIYQTDADSDNTKWYEIPAGGNAFGQQVYYYKNVATGVYLQGSTRTPGEGGDWTVSAATASATNDNSNLFKWSKVASNWGNGPWLVNEEGNTGELPSGDNKNAFFALTMLTANSEFFGVDVPNVAVSNPHDGGNAWTAVEINVAETGVNNPDYRLENTKTVDVIQITTWMTPNNATWGTDKPYVASDGTNIVYQTDAASDNTKWYEIPAGAGAFGQQVYYYKNVATGVYLQGSTRTPGEGGDWTVSTATASATNDGSNLFKWSKVPSNWGNGPWLVNEEGNTGELPSGDNKNAFFALTMLTANSEFFGVDVPNVAVSNPHDGGNAWTAVEINIAESGVANPDYKGSDKELLYSISELNLFDGAAYNEETHIVTYDNGWAYAGWSWEDKDGLTVTKYDQAWIKFDASALPQTGDGGRIALIEFEVGYMDDTKQVVQGNCENEELVVDLDPGKKVKYIFLKSENAGTVELTDAYFFRRPVDLTLSDIRWEPANPKPGDEITFFATIKNNSNIASQAEIKHGIAFQVNGSVVTWCDGFFGPIAAGEEKEVSATMDGSTGEVWACGANPSYAIKAEVNDTKDVKETDYDNNTLEATLTVDGEVDLVVTDFSWTPEEPEAKENVLFSLKVKNNGTLNAPAGIDKKIKFYVNGEAVTWYENYTTAIAANAEVLITANASAGGSGQRYRNWEVPANGTYTLKAEVNGDQSITEGDYTNNFIEKQLQVGPTGISDVLVDGGNIYISNGTLYLVNYPVASVGIYGLLGQKVAAFEAVANQVDVNLASGVYVVEVQFDGKTVTHKVFVK